MKIAVTGAAGFIGRFLVPALRAEGWDVLSLTEPGVREPGEESLAIPVDILSRRDLERVFAGSDAVVHLAARNHVRKEKAKDPLAEYRRVNVEGTENVVRAASSAPVGVVIHLSSVKAMGEESGVILDETSPCAPATPYGTSKLESERVVAEEAVRSGTPAVILRLPMVYGPCDKGNFPRMVRWADRRMPFPLFQPDNLRSMVYVQNVVAGILAVLKRGARGVTTYIVKDREDYSTRTVYATICRELGRNPLFLPVPAPLVRLVGGLSDDFRKITGSLCVSSAKITGELGFVSPHSLEEGVARTVEWYRRSSH